MRSNEAGQQYTLFEGSMYCISCCVNCIVIVVLGSSPLELVGCGILDTNYQVYFSYTCFEQTEFAVGVS